MRKIFFFLTISFCFINFISAQEKVEKQYELKGVVKDKNFGVIAGLPLFFKSNNIETFVSTDLNGEFSIKLLPGNYEVTVKKNISETFAAFIKISGDGLNPNYVEFNIETNPVCCGTVLEKPYPKIVASDKPLYPAAASAVRAAGEVIVNVKIDNQGKVISTKAVSGHPLLRTASEQSAYKFLFEPSKIEDGKITLTFVFLPPQREKENIKRYSNPYRIEVVGENAIIDY